MKLSGFFAVHSQLDRMSNKAGSPEGVRQAMPLVAGLLRHATRQTTRLHTPGHSGGRDWSGGWGRRMAGAGALDLTELPDLGDGHSTEELVRQAEILASRAFGAGRTFFLSGGATLGLQAAILSAAGPGDDVIIPQNAHRAVIQGLILSGANPVFMGVPAASSGVPLGVGPENLRAALAGASRPRLVVLVSPTYQGLAVNLPALIQLAHSFDVPVLVDEAHGSHFSFHPGFPSAAGPSGADIWVQSAHKTLGALTGAAMLHLNTERLPHGGLERSLAVLGSTSPSYLLLASLDVARHRMAQSGRRLWERALAAAFHIRAELERLPGVRCIGPDEVGHGGIIAFDPTRVAFSVEGMYGVDVASALRRVGVEAEYADERLVCLIIPYSVSRMDRVRLLRGMSLALSRRTAVNAEGLRELPQWPRPADVAMNPRKAWQAPSESLLLSKAFGRVSAETIAPCPPGIPVLIPGQRITADCLDYLEAVMPFDAVVRVVTEG